VFYYPAGALSYRLLYLWSLRTRRCIHLHRTIRVHVDGYFSGGLWQIYDFVLEFVIPVVTFMPGHVYASLLSDRPIRVI
jgi:hypothetical protein